MTYVKVGAAMESIPLAPRGAANATQHGGLRGRPYLSMRRLRRWEVHSRSGGRAAPGFRHELLRLPRFLG